jgi:hypothetical protein
VLYHQPVGCAALVAALSATTNIIESPYAGVRIQTRRVTNWQNGSMARRWMASAIPENGEELPQDHALSRTLDSGGDSERIAVSHSTGRAVVTSTPTADANFQLCAGHPAYQESDSPFSNFIEETVKLNV